MPADTQIWRVTPRGRAAAVVVAVAVVALAVGVTAGGSSVGVVVILWLAAVFVGLGAWRWAFVPYVAMNATGLDVQNFLGRAQISYDDIDAVGVSYAGLTIVRRSGRPVVAWAVQKSNLAIWFHRRTRADEVADAIRARIR